MKNKVEMRVQAPETRINNFDEVALGYTKNEAIIEASRCLDCKHFPCVSGCPVGIDIPKFIREISEDNLEAASKTILKDNLLLGICGRVCPQESQCEAKCVRGIKGEAIAIGRLERYVSDNYQPEITAVKSDKEKVAVVGSGPAGLACAGVLGQMGYEVHIFEALHEAGGVLSYGIPEFRLPKRIVKSEINGLKKIGVQFHLNTVIGRTKTINGLFNEGYQAVFIGSGAGLPKFMDIPGENLNGVLSANEFLTRINLMKAFLPEYDTPLKKMKKVVVVGGGNVAMDAARSAKRLGVEEVFLVYRRSREEMPARLEEIAHAEEEAISFQLLKNPVKIIGDENNNVIGIECIKMALGEPDASGRRRPIEIAGSNFLIECDTVIMSLGNHPNPLLASSMPDLEINKWGCIVVDEKLRTSKEGVYAGGDIVTGAATVILAMGAGKKAAYEIDKYIRSKHAI
ncbi:MAG: NADPH-dependent glutamate synthase [Bacilli bacterium]|nr:NADPH-dependent glutamate synthase [Bacilli bacterium]